MSIEGMNFEAKAGKPRKKKPKTLQKSQKPNRTLQVKDPPGYLPGKQIPFPDKKKVEKIDQNTHGKLRRNKKMRHKAQIDTEFNILASHQTIDTINQLNDKSELETVYPFISCTKSKIKAH